MLTSLTQQDDLLRRLPPTTRSILRRSRDLVDSRSVHVVKAACAAVHHDYLSSLVCVVILGGDVKRLHRLVDGVEIA